ncbi:peptidase M15 [Xylophilus rhododendri]|uniref:D-alanyl-D-alanine dipeptidase n=1 Tax=Xylophilus rhododendri TaxID=2697032 RepID=A0A857J9U4_9BURK|nr:M15 family metallopeptidase [Xylophilus rhododendri]QHI99993.1 peptidase M15 [Xylophilus rhododendri]
MNPVSNAIFVDLAKFDPGLLIDARYAGHDNFLGRPAAGYDAPICLLTLRAALALSTANRLAARLGLGLKVFDGYRPQRAVDDFLQWAADPEDPRTRAMYHPTLQKHELVPLGYISARSGHSRGSSVDLTLVRLIEQGQPVPADPGALTVMLADEDFLPNGELDMGSPFDFFGADSRMDKPEIDPQFMRRRRLLRSLMQAAGFQGIAQEWWHFGLVDEPFPQTYFDFPIAQGSWLQS